jgi:protocatechuate 4,5-dioxygenase alpha chain
MDHMIVDALIDGKPGGILRPSVTEAAPTEETPIMVIHAKAAQPAIPGTTLFDGEQARKGYQLNKMCYSFNDAANRAAFKADEAAYCERYQLTPEQRAAVEAKNVLQLIAAGGNVYYLAKFAGIFGLDVQDLGAQQTGKTKAEFIAMLAAYAH